MTHDDTARMARELLEYDGDRRMSEWELQFVETMSERSTFSESQANKVGEVWQSIFG